MVKRDSGALVESCGDTKTCEPKQERDKNRQGPTFIRGGTGQSGTERQYQSPLPALARIELDNSFAQQAIDIGRSSFFKTYSKEFWSSCLKWCLKETLLSQTDVESILRPDATYDDYAKCVSPVVDKMEQTISLNSQYGLMMGGRWRVSESNKLNTFSFSITKCTILDLSRAYDIFEYDELYIVTACLEDISEKLTPMCFHDDVDALDESAVMSSYGIYFDTPKIEKLAYLRRETKKAFEDNAKLVKEATELRGTTDKKTLKEFISLWLEINELLEGLTPLQKWQNIIHVNVVDTMKNKDIKLLANPIVELEHRVDVPCGTPADIQRVFQYAQAIDLCGQMFNTIGHVNVFR